MSIQQLEQLMFVITVRGLTDSAAGGGGARELGIAPTGLTKAIEELAKSIELLTRAVKGLDNTMKDLTTITTNVVATRTTTNNYQLVKRGPSGQGQVAGHGMQLRKRKRSSY